MDAPWMEDSVFPSVMDWQARAERLEPIVFKSWRKDLLIVGQQLSKDLFELPYEPHLWLQRGIVLSDLGFPELALGDVYKSILLCDSIICGQITTSGETQPSQFPFIHWISAKLPKDLPIQNDTVEISLLRTEALMEWFKVMREARCFQDCIDIAEKIKLHPSDEWVLEMIDEQLQVTRNCFKSWLNESGVQGTGESSIPSRYGFIHRRNYPWMTKEHLSRSDETMEQILAELETATAKGPPGHQSNAKAEYPAHCGLIKEPLHRACSVRRSKKGVGLGGGFELDDFAVFAERDIKLEETILVDSNRMELASSPGQEAPSYADLIPRALELNLRHRPAFDVHPLEDIILSRWKPEDRQETAPLVPFSFKEHVEKPLAAVIGLKLWRYHDFSCSEETESGSDIFCDPHLDTWVLQQLNNRISMNHQVVQVNSGSGVHSQPCKILPALKEDTPRPDCYEDHTSKQTALILGYLLPLFNHSCDNNVRTELTAEGLRIIAKKNIRKGEELCVSYIRSGLCYEERTEALRPWFDECRCSLCNQHRMNTSSNRNVSSWQGLASYLYSMASNYWNAFRSMMW